MTLLKLLSGRDVNLWEPAVIALGHHGAVSDKIRALGIKVHSLEMTGSLPPSPAAIWRFLALVRDYKPQVIQGWMYHGNLMASLAGFFTFRRTPVIWNVRQCLSGFNCEKRMTALVICLGAKLSRLPRRIIYNSRVGARQHERLGYSAERTIIIPNGFDCERFRPAPGLRPVVRQRLGISKNSLLIGLIARYHPVKDHANFISAAAKLSSKQKDVHFVLAGADVNRDNHELKEMIDNANLWNRVHLLGEQENMAELIAALDLATSSSFSEAFPNVVGEAMACGVPCVVTDVGDSAHIVEGVGLAVPPKNSDALAAGWGRMLALGQEQRKILGDAARQRIIKHYPLAGIAARYSQLYSDVAGDGLKLYENERRQRASGER